MDLSCTEEMHTTVHAIQPSLLPLVDFLVNVFGWRLPQETCVACEKKVLPDDPRHPILKDAAHEQRPTRCRAEALRECRLEFRWCSSLEYRSFRAAQRRVLNVITAYLSYSPQGVLRSLVSLQLSSCVDDRAALCQGTPKID